MTTRGRGREIENEKEKGLETGIVKEIGTGEGGDQEGRDLGLGLPAIPDLGLVKVNIVAEVNDNCVYIFSTAFKI